MIRAGIYPRICLLGPCLRSPLVTWDEAAYDRRDDRDEVDLTDKRLSDRERVPKVSAGRVVPVADGGERDELK